jgi:hypothetical protein
VPVEVIQWKWSSGVAGYFDATSVKRIAAVGRLGQTKLLQPFTGTVWGDQKREVSEESCEDCRWDLSWDPEVYFIHYFIH